LQISFIPVLYFALLLPGLARRTGEASEVVEPKHDYGDYSSEERISDKVLLEDFAVFSDRVTFHTLYCVTCGRGVGQMSSLLSIHSNKAVDRFNNTLFSYSFLTQVFKNPAGKLFELMTLRKASVKQWPPRVTDDSTWFEGYSWSVATCPVCNAHLGWTFRREIDVSEFPQAHPFHELYPETFVALDISKLESERPDLSTAQTEEEEEHSE